jgi:hypothetical protein
MNNFMHCIVDENGEIVSQQEISPAMAEIMVSGNVTITTPTEKDGVISHGIWFDPGDFDPRLKPGMTDNDRETVAARTEAIVRSFVLTMRPDLAHHHKLDYWLDLSGAALFAPKLAEQAAGTSNRQIYIILAEEIIERCDKAGPPTSFEALFRRMKSFWRR